MNILKIIDKIVFGILKIICIVTFTLVTVLISTNVIMRFVPLFSTHILDEILELVYSALIFYGVATLWITNDHFKFDMLINKIKNIKLRNSILIFTELLVLFFLVIFTYYSLNLTLRAQDFSLIFQIPKKLYYVSMPISGLIMTAYTIKNIVVQIREMLNVNI